MLHEAIAETYIPLLNAVNELIREGFSPRLTVGLTPILLEQLNDEDVKNHFEAYIEDKITLSKADVARFEEKGDERRLSLALFYLSWYRNILESFQVGYQRDLVGAFRRLQDEGYFDILTSAATHGYLPLLERDSSIYGQLAVGVEHYRHLMGRAPQGIWLPECGYRPAYLRQTEAGEIRKPGIEEFLEAQGLSYFFTDSHVITGGMLTGKAAGDVVGPYGSIPTRETIPLPADRPHVQSGTTFRPCYVHSSNVAVFGRDEGTGVQVWSATHGYPGDLSYREFHRKDPRSGLQYWRVTDAGTDLAEKDLYDPGRAQERAHVHADHFARLVKQELMDFHARTGRYGIVVSAYDTELFGHWWFEGITWIKEVLRRLSLDEEVELTTAASYLAAHSPEEAMALPESSWGQGGTHWTWLNPETEWMWALIHHAERKMERLVERFTRGGNGMRALLNQIGRELLLMQSSDWPFLITTGQATGYATNRFQEHVARFNHLTMLAESQKEGGDLPSFLREMFELDDIFPHLDYRLFAEREGCP